MDVVILLFLLFIISMFIDNSFPFGCHYILFLMRNIF